MKSLNLRRLVVIDPIGNVLDSRRSKIVGRVVSLSQPRTEPSDGSFSPSNAKNPAITSASQLIHIGADRPFRTTSDLSASLNKCMTATRRKIRPATREKVIWLMKSSPPREGSEEP